MRKTVKANIGKDSMRQVLKGKDKEKNIRTGVKNSLCVTLITFYLMCFIVVAPLSKKAYATTQEEALLGYWVTPEHDGVFKIERCGNSLCGNLVGLRYDGNDVPRGHDGKSECNIRMLTDFHRLSADSTHLNGHVLDPDSGKIYNAQLWSPDRDVLKLRGYVAIPLFGETHTWTRYKGGPIGPECKMP